MAAAALAPLRNRPARAAENISPGPPRRPDTLCSALDEKKLEQSLVRLGIRTATWRQPTALHTRTAS